MPPPTALPDTVDEIPSNLQALYTCRPGAIWTQVRTEPMGFWIACGYLFFEYVRPQTIYPWLDVIPWGMLLAFGAFGLGMLNDSRRAKGNPIGFLILLYGVVVLLASLFALHPSLSFQKLDVYLAWVLVYFGITRNVTTRPQFFVFLLLFILCNYKMTQHGFFSWASRGFGFADWGVTGAPGWFHNSGEFGIQLCVITPMAVAFAYALRPFWGRIAKVFFYLLPVTAVGSALATSSRGALVGLVAVAAWSLRSSRNFVRTAIAIAAVATISWVVMPDDFKARFETAGDDQTSEHRLERWGLALSMLGERPLLGVGHKNWETYFRSKYGTGEEVGGSAMVHNIFLESATEHGLLGLGVLLAIIVSMFRLNALTRRHAARHGMRFEYLMSHGMDAALVGMLASASFITVLYYPYVWIHAALVTCLYNSTCAEASLRSRPSPRSATSSAQPVVSA